MTGVIGILSETFLCSSVYAQIAVQSSGAKATRANNLIVSVSIGSNDFQKSGQHKLLGNLTPGATPEPSPASRHKTHPFPILPLTAPPQGRHLLLASNSLEPQRPQPSPHIIQDVFPLQLSGSIDIAKKKAG